MLHGCNALLKQLYNLDLTFKENWPKKRNWSITRLFSGTVVKVLLGTKIVFEKVLTHCSIKVRV